MLSKEQATDIVEKTFPTGRINSSIEYQGLYVFQVFQEDPNEGRMDPFFSVNQETGELRDFSVLTDGNPQEIQRLFLAAQGRI